MEVLEDSVAAVIGSDFDRSGRLEWLERVAPLGNRHVMRDSLVSQLLQDRETARVLSAPHGYGKSELAREYALRMFEVQTTLWIDASSPGFLSYVDGGAPLAIFEMGGAYPALIVFDDLAWLHEQRADTLSRCIEKLLYNGVEVLVTTLPSRDCLTSLLDGPLVLRARDLAVSERECMDSRRPLHPEEQARRQQQWDLANKSAFGRAPASFWGDTYSAQRACLAGFFGECLSDELLRIAFWILVVQCGSMDQASRICGRISSDALSLLCRDYPFLGIARSGHGFSAAHVSISSLKEALQACGLQELPVQHGMMQMATALRVLMEQGALKRAGEVLEELCEDDQCTRLLVDYGFDLLDHGQTRLVERILQRCEPRDYREFPELVVMRAWCAGLQGNVREACHFADAAMLALGPMYQSGADLERIAAVSALSYIAFLAFGKPSVAPFSEYTAAEGMASVTSFGFLTEVLGACTQKELARACCLESSKARGALAKQRSAVGKKRDNALTALVTSRAKCLGDTLGARLALHLLCFVDSSRLRRLVQDLACDEVVRLRGSEVSRTSEALLLRDLWQQGYFGVGHGSADSRDVRMLEQAAAVLDGFAESAGVDPLDTPWRVDGAVVVQPRNRVGTEAPGDIEIMNIRMFGALEVTIGKNYISDTDLRKKSRLALVLIALQQGRDVSRETLFEQMWPGMDHLHALDNFYVVWSNLCAALGQGPYLERNGEFCRVNSQFVRSDVAEFERLARRLLVRSYDQRELLDIYAQIEAIYCGRLVPAEGENTYLASQRDRYSAMYIDSMIAASECALAAHDARVALWFGRKAMEEGVKREDVYHCLMSAQIAAGQRCSAIRTYFECKEYLQSELGLDPSIETQGLYDRLISVDPSLLKLESTTFAPGT